MKSQPSQTPADEAERELPSAEYLRIGALPARELGALMLRGERPDPDRLAGWEFRGLNTPAFTRLLGIKKFIKGFYKNADGQLYGYNMPVVQDAVESPWRYKHPADPKRFGFYRVDPVDPAARDNVYLSSLLLDYGRGGNHELDPTSTLRDYLVRVEPGADDLLLGKAYVALGPLRLPTSYFVLERLRPTTFVR